MKNTIRIFAVAISVALSFFFTGCPKAANTVDVTAPAEVTALKAVASLGQVALTWTNPSDSDFDHCVVYYGTGGTAGTEFTGTVSAAGTTIAGLTGATEYTFKVETVDTTGNVSTGSTVAATPLAGGNLTVTINNASAQDGNTFVVKVYPAGADTSTATPLATKTGTIASGSASVVVDQYQTTSAWEGTDGTTYDVHCFIDTNGNKALDAGIDYVDRYFPKSYTQNGDEAITADYSDFLPYDSVMLEVVDDSGSSAIEGKTVLAGIYNSGDTSNLLSSTGTSTTVTSGVFRQVMLAAPNYTTDWVGTNGNPYDLYIWIDMNGNVTTVQSPETGIDMEYKTFPISITKNKTMWLTYKYSDFVTVP